MFSKKLVLAFLTLFLFLSISALIQNMPAPKNKRVYEEILPYFPYKIEKELGGIDIVDKRTGEDLDIANSKVYLAFDDLLKKWGKTHLKLENKELIILDDNGKEVKRVQLQNPKEVEWVINFFELR